VRLQRRPRLGDPLSGHRHAGRFPQPPGLSSLMSIPGLALRSRSFRLPKRGHALEECEDACACAPERGRFAVADGAAESAHAGPWARLLVEEFVRGGEALASWANSLPAMQARWASEVGDLPQPAALPWYLERKARQGAFATFLGLVVEESGWHALAVG